MICKKCGSQIKDGLKFCTSCGAPVEQEDAQSKKQSSQQTTIIENQSFYCPSCGAENEPNSVFCTSCGASLMKDNHSGGVEETSHIGIVCPQCHQTIQDGDDFCPNCGYYLNKDRHADHKSVFENEQTINKEPAESSNTVFCYNCGTKNDANSPYCTNCGKSLKEDELLSDNVSEPKKKFGKRWKRDSSANKNTILIPVISVIVLAFCLYGSWMLIDHSCSAEMMAERYFVSMVNGDYDQAFRCLNVKESELINPDAFKEYIAELDLGDVTNYKIDETDIDNSSSLFGITSDSDKSESGELGKDFVITYRRSGDSQDRKFPVTVNKSTTKKYLIFEQWNIGYDQIICNDVAITVPAESSVTMNGVTLPESMIESAESASNDIYMIPSLFTGVYNIDITKEGFSDRQSSIVVSESDQNFSVMEMTLSEENVRTLQKQAVSDIQKIYDAAIHGKPFTEISSLFSTASSNFSGIQDSYNTLRKSMSGEFNITSLKISDINVYSDSDEAGINVQYSYELNYQKTSGYDAGNPKTSDGDKNTYLSYILSGDQWVLEDFPSLSLGYW